MKTMTLNVSLTPYYRAIIRRFLKAGRYESDSDVVRAALQRLEETEWDPDAYPPAACGTFIPRPAIARNASSTR
jgi:Arc/MetJ-type ribon-helix-helix transcriptional regulator